MKLTLYTCVNDAQHVRKEWGTGEREMCNTWERKGGTCEREMCNTWERNGEHVREKYATR